MRIIVVLALVLLLATNLMVGQSSTSKPTAAPSAAATPKAEESDGEVYNGYKVNQSIEFGGRISSQSGNLGIWDTYVNQFSGPRIFDQWLEMRSITREGTMFDRLNFSNVGYGGDPNNISRIRISKDRWYDFTGQFRRDRNVFDYNLLANPLNPSTSNPNVPILDSPHEFTNVRRMWDYGLIIKPQSKIRLRLAYNRNVSQGPTYSSTHIGTDARLLQNWFNTNNQYTFGFDFRMIPRTQISYDQTFQYFKGDTNWQLAATPYLMANPVAGGAPISVDLGLPFNTAASQPCAAPILGTGFVNPTCNAYLGYNKYNNSRTFIPVEKMSFQSSYFKDWEFSGGFTYSKSTYDLPSYRELFTGLSSRTRSVFDNFVGNIQNKRFNGNAEFGATWRVNDHLSIQESFHWNNNRLPGLFNINENQLFSSSMAITANPYLLANCATINAAGCPQHSSSSGPDILSGVYSNYWAQQQRMNTLVADVDVNRNFGFHAGYRYNQRIIQDHLNWVYNETYYPILPNRGDCVGVALDANNVCRVTVTNLDPGDNINLTEQTGLIGIWYQPNRIFRATFDTELSGVDGVFVRTSPRTHQVYKFRTIIKPTDEWQVNATYRGDERKNDQSDIMGSQHDRILSFGTVYQAKSNWGIDVNYAYNDINSSILICFVGNPVGGTAPSCATGYLTANSVYISKNSYFSGNVFFKPLTRVTASVGYTVNADHGSSVLLNPLQPNGPLDYIYHLPSASLQVNLTSRWTWNTAWNHYEYHENSDPGPTLPRNMRGDVVNLSLRYKF